MQRFLQEILKMKLPAKFEYRKIKFNKISFVTFKNKEKLASWATQLLVSNGPILNDYIKTESHFFKDNKKLILVTSIQTWTLLIIPTTTSQ